MTVYIIKYYRNGFLAYLFQADKPQLAMLSGDNSDIALTKFYEEYPKKKYTVIGIKGVK